MLSCVRKWLLVALLTNLFCAPGRDNPYDPNSPLYESFGRLRGRTLTKASNPIDSVKLTVRPADRFVFSNPSGLFEIDSLSLDSCFILADKEGYAPESVFVTIESRAIDTVNLFLNALPYFTFYQAQSFHIHAITDIFYVLCSARVNDPDGFGDVANVFLHIESLSDSFELNYQPNTGTFDMRVKDILLPGGSLESLIGQDLTFTVKDKSHDSRSVVTQLARLIYQFPEKIYPQDGDSTNASPTITWHSLNLPFAFSYRAEINRYGNLAWEVAKTNPLDTTATVTVLLEPGVYTWAVWVVDEFGNASRSAESGFYVR
jgi:hypothetical protein